MENRTGNVSQGPDVQQAPCRVSLAARKTDLYRPDLPTLRRMKMDDEASKLPGEHCRNTTKCSADVFSDTTFTLFDYPKATHAALLFSYAGGSLRISDKFSPDGKRYTIPSVHIEKPWSHYKPLITNASNDWSRFVSECGEFVLPKRDHKDLHYSGYAVRYLKPNITQSWKWYLQSEPSVSNYDQKPIPVNTLNRFRSLSSPFSNFVKPKLYKGVNGGDANQVLSCTRASQESGEYSITFSMWLVDGGMTLESQEIHMSKICIEINEVSDPMPSLSWCSIRVVISPSRCWGIMSKPGSTVDLHLAQLTDVAPSGTQ